ncbi:MAG: gliding motility-associated C-terminal domain-containing protein [Bacteroidota bacterium]|nr:gliding motility-associated C-terminal domain-containing protein [Bacteroidota bacterium]
MKKNLLVLLFFICIIQCRETKATHMMGADIEYTCRGKDTFDFIIRVFKDCKGSQLSPIQMTIDGIGCSYTSSYTMTQISCKDITPVCKTSCSKCDHNNCNADGKPNGTNAACSFAYGIEKVIFTQTVVFTGTNCCKFRVSYSQANRNAAINTCCALEVFFSYAELNRCITPCNNSPTLTNDPVAMYCVGNCICFNNGARDTSNFDSISYHMAPAYNALNSKCTYVGSYTYQYPLYYDGFPTTKKYNDKTCKGWLLDSINGDLCFKPMQQQSAVVVIDLKEWRKDSNGKMVQIGLTRRDMQLIIVANCTNKAPSLPSASQVGCAGDLICFSGIKSSDPDSKDTVRLTWNYGIPKGTFTSKFNGSKKQEFDFCWQTVDKDASNTPYFFTVKAIDDACPLSGQFSRSYSILVKKNPKASRKYTNLACGLLRMEATPLNLNKAKEIFTYQWTVPFPGGSKYNVQDTVHQFHTSGQHIIRCEVTVNGCTMAYDDTIDIPPFVSVDIGPDSILCAGKTLSLKAKVTDGIKPFRYLWSPGAAGDTLSTFAIDTFNSTYIACMVKDSFDCVSYDTMILTIMPPPPVYLGPDKRVCKGDSITFDAGDNNGTGNVKAYIWTDMATNTTIGTNRYITVWDSITLVATVYDSTGCVGRDTVCAFFNPKVKLNAGPDKYQCYGDYTDIKPTGADSIIWYDLATGNLIHIGDSLRMSFTATTQLVLHGINTYDNVSCENWDTVQIDLKSPPKLDLEILQGCVDKGYNTKLTLKNAYDSITGQSIKSICTWQWSATDSLLKSCMDTVKNEVDIKKLGATYAWGTKQNGPYCIITCFTNYGCKKVDSIKLIVDPLPPIKIKPLSICINQDSVKLDNRAYPNAGGNPVSTLGQKWSGNGIVQTGTSWYFKPKLAGLGQHIITYEYVDINSCKASDTLSFFVKPIPVVARIIPSPLCCTDGIQDLWKLTKASPITGTWHGTGVLDSILGTFDPALVLSPNNVGASPVASNLIFYVDGFGCPVSDTFQITINPVPLVDIQPDRDICFDSIPWNLPMYNNPGVVWMIDTIIAPYSTFSPGTWGIGPHKLTFLYTNPNTGCKNKDSMTLNVIEPPIVKIKPVNALCAGESFTVGCTFKNASGVAWLSSGGGVFIAPNDTITGYIPSATDITNGFFLLEVRTTGNGVCNLAIDTYTVFIFPVPVPTPLVLQKSCSPLDAVFAASSQIPNCIYTWDFGDPASGTLNNATTADKDSVKHLYINKTNQVIKFTVTLTVTSPQGCDSTMVWNNIVEVYPNPIADFEPKPRKATIALPRIRFANLSKFVTDSTKWEWKFGDPLNGTSTDKNPTYWYANTDTGTYIVFMKATTEYGCVDSTEQTVRIGPEMLVFIPNAFTPDPFGPIKNNRFWVEASNYSEFEIYIFNRWGENVFYSKDRLPGWDGKFKDEECQVDVYVYQVNIRNFEGKWFHYNGTVHLIR